MSSCGDDGGTKHLEKTVSHVLKKKSKISCRKIRH